MEIRKIRLSSAHIIAITLIALGILLRLAPHEPNFAPVGAIALFGGALFGWRTALWLPLAIMMTTDIFLGSHSTIVFTWGGFVLISLFGTLFRSSSFWKRVLAGGLGSGAVFYAVSNFGTWLTTDMYAHTFVGLADCYVAALPFFRASLTADLFYGFVLFGLYALAIRLVAARQPETHSRSVQ